MAKEVITRFKLETTAFDSKIKQASKELSDYSRTATQAKEGFNQFTKANVDAARALGTMATSSNNAKVKVQELVSAYNEAAKAYEKLSDEQKQSDWAKALAGSLTQLQQRIKDTKQEMQGLGNEMKGSGLFGGGKLDGMLQVFGGNLMTKAAGFAASFASEIGSCVQQGIELARQGEGTRIAFERLGRGDILQGLREATHGTVTDLELMKAAVKFNDFKLPVEELGTMLAFAQQKAKDTGQSVDYMVDSIVMGLGRKSLMILDNLGLSAAEIKEKMKETGDMTKAVGAIIREQMAKAGDYVETAADRAAQANVNLQNKMEELGRKFAPIEEASNQLWTSMKIGILDIVGGPLARLLNGLTEAGRMRNALDDMGGNEQVDKQLGKLRVAKAAGSGYMTRSLYNDQVEQYNRQINTSSQQLKDIRAWQSGDRSESLRTRVNAITEKYGSLDATKIKAEMDAYKYELAQYRQGAQQILNASNVSTGGTGGTGDKNKNAKTEQTELQQNQAKINALTQEYVKLGDESTEVARNRQAEIQKEIKLLEQRNGLLGLRAEQAQGRLLHQTIDLNTNGVAKGSGLFGKETQSALSKPAQLSDKAMKAVEKNIQKQTDLQVKELKEKDKEDKSLATGLGKLSGGFGQLDQGLSALGIDLGDGFGSVVSGLQGISSILMAIQTIVAAIQAISAIDTIIPFAGGGIIGKAAGGMLIPGNSFSGDNLRMPVDGGRGWVGLNSGELILNRVQQNNLANALAGGGMQNLNLSASISGEQIRLVLNNNGRRTGRGEYVQTNFG